MATVLRQSTQIVVRIGPAVAVGDGFTPVTTLTLSGADEAELLKAAGAATVSIAGATFAAITGADGWYDLTLTTSHTDTVGELVVVVNDDSLILPIYQRFQVIEEAVYDALYAASSTGRLGVLRTGTAQAGSTTTITLDASASAVDDFYNACQVAIVSGTGAGQVRMIADYVGSTQVATIDIYRAWATAPDSTSVFEILPAAGVPLSGWGQHTTTSLFTSVSLGGGTTLPGVYARVTHVKDDSAAAANMEAFFDGTGYAGTGNVIPTVTTVTGVAAGGITAASIATGAIDADAVAADAVTEIQAGLATAASVAALNDITAAEVLAAGDIDGYTLEEFAKLALAALAGKLSGAATTTVTIRAADDSKARITATVDSDGNRTALTLDETG